MNFKKLTSGFLSVLTVVALVFASSSCSETETTDSTKFAIYYSGMTDIGPSMSGIISSPTYLGSAPSQFAITRVTLKNEPFSGNSFTIDPDNGSISIDNTADIPVGLYRISVSCVSGGTSHDFKDIVEVNLMKAVPEGITVEPNKLKADYKDIVDEASEVELPTAQVKTNGDHVSIRKYEIAKSATSHFFAISQTGEISIVRGSKEIQPGVYVLSLKLTTGASAEDEGLFEQAVEINVTSKPLSLTYTPNSGKIEEETDGGTTLTTTAPVLRGSQEGVVYTLKSIAPATDKIKIDPASGALSVAAGHGFKIGEKYVIDVNVINEHAPEGVDFSQVYTLEVVSFIEPIENFAYESAARTQAIAFEWTHTADFKGDEATFELINLPAALQGQLTIGSHNGTLSAPKGNTIPLGEHSITVKASNPKGEQTTTAILTIKENKNFFTYIQYGNNLGLPTTGNASQYRIPVDGKLTDLDIPAPTTDAKVDLTWEVSSTHQTSGTVIDEKTGDLTLKGLKVNNCGMVLVTATAGKGTEEAVSVTVPVFFHYSGAVNGVTIEYTPFVLQANPKKANRSAVPRVIGVTAPAKFLLDYRRTFNYYNIRGRHTNGQPNVSGSLLQTLWDAYAGGPGMGNYGSKDPVSYYSNETDLSRALTYADRDHSVVVNPNKWVVDGEYANGAMIGQMTFTTDGNTAYLNDSKNPNQVFPLFIWFDEKF